VFYCFCFLLQKYSLLLFSGHKRLAYLFASIESMVFGFSIGVTSGSSAGDQRGDAVPCTFSGRLHWMNVTLDKSLDLLRLHDYMTLISGPYFSAFLHLNTPGAVIASLFGPMFPWYLLWYLPKHLQFVFL
jgi:hypothetical protein